MDLQFFITVNLMMLSLTTITVTLILRPQGGHAWIATNAALVLIGSGALFLLPQWSGAIMLCAAVPLVIAPMVFAQLAQRRATQNRLLDAAFYSRLATFFYPAGRSRFDAELARALAITNTGDSIAALSALASDATPEQTAVLQMWICRARDDWDGVLEFAKDAPNATGIAAVLIRALGETGRLDEMVRVYIREKRGLSGSNLYYVQLFVMAFCGRANGVEFILRHQLRLLSAEAKSYWRAIAALASGRNAAAARDAFSEIELNASDPRIRAAAQRRLSVPLAENAATLPPEAVAAAAAIEARLHRDANRYAPRVRRIPVTLALLAINTVMYLVEVMNGGSEDLTALVNLGALWPPLLLESGEWWRLVTGLFLHYGFLHFAVNSVALLVVGRMVENLTGSVRMLTAYLFGGVLSSSAVLAAMWFDLTQHAVLVGASGAIFAVLGLEAARQLINWLRSRDVLDRRELLVLGAVVLMQFWIDLSVPEISLTAHASGFLGGVLIGVGLAAANGWRLERAV